NSPQRHRGHRKDGRKEILSSLCPLCLCGEFFGTIKPMSASRTDAPGPFALAVLRRALLIFLPAALVTGGVVLALYYQDRANERILDEQARAHLVDLHADIIARELKAVQSDLLYLAKQKPLADFLSNGRTSKAELEDEYILFCGQKAVYDQIRYLDATGMERIRVNYDNGKP